MRIVTLLAAIGCLSACAGQATEPDAGGAATGFENDSRPLGKTLVYECLGYEFLARLGPGEMAVWLEDEYLVLSQVRSASGVKYEEGNVMFFGKGDEGVIEVAGQRYPDCQLAPERAPWEDARRRGVNFRASGNEPGWYLEYQEGKQLLYVGAYGSERILLADPGIQWQEGTRLLQAREGDNELILEIVTEDCNDSMSGAAYPAAVSLVVNGQSLSGCGMDLTIPWE